ncbi:MAG: hypothetical protein HOV97_13145 [Nonomuraea sp.]|nr:hypothetical protein [Nonomuraea sp.]NUS03499.1 hypothetical protein [Nonomuraea sp.]NUT43739.1 hypothetical protein [Thermoactinospora sp.]
MKAVTNAAMLRIRRHRPDRNPLRRRSDRLESAGLVLAVLLVLISVWPAVLAGRFTYANGLREARVGPGHRQQVTATVLLDPRPTRVAFGESATATVEASWTTPSGAARTGAVQVPATAKAGSTVSLWVDREGAPTTPPPTRADVVLRSWGLAVFVEVIAVLLVVAAVAALRGLLDRRRYAEWDAAWARANDRWRRPRRP